MNVIIFQFLEDEIKVFTVFSLRKIYTKNFEDRNCIRKQGNQQFLELKYSKARSNSGLSKVDCFVSKTKVESWHSELCPKSLQHQNVIIDNTLNKVFIMMHQSSRAPYNVC